MQQVARIDWGREALSIGPTVTNYLMGNRGARVASGPIELLARIVDSSMTFADLFGRLLRATLNLHHAGGTFWDLDPRTNGVFDLAFWATMLQSGSYGAWRGVELS